MTAAATLSIPCFSANSQPWGSTRRSSKTEIAAHMLEHHPVGRVVEEARHYRDPEPALAAAPDEAAQGHVGLDLEGEDRVLGAGGVDDRIEVLGSPQHGRPALAELEGRHRVGVDEPDRNEADLPQVAEPLLESGADLSGPDDDRPAPRAAGPPCGYARGRKEHSPDDQHPGRQGELDRDQVSVGRGRLGELDDARDRNRRHCRRADDRPDAVEARDLGGGVVEPPARHQHDRQRTGQQHQDRRRLGVDRVGDEERGEEEQRVDGERDVGVARPLEEPVKGRGDLLAPGSSPLRRR